MTQSSNHPSNDKQSDLVQQLKKLVQNLERYLIAYEKEISEKRHILLDKITAEIELINDITTSMKKEVRVVVGRLVKHWPLFLQHPTEDNFAVICQEVATVYESLLH